MKALAKNWNTGKMTTVLNAKRAITVKAADLAYSNERGEILRAMLTLLAR